MTRLNVIHTTCLLGFKDHPNFDEAQCSMETLFLLTTAVPPDFILQAKGVAHLYW